ncbi:hypothetical protein PWT90_04629 [Aphanocladium album]|nr:hypothetical protein PWT90_04629 [Aphanocladium album]
MPQSGMQYPLRSPSPQYPKAQEGKCPSLTASGSKKTEQRKLWTSDVRTMSAERARELLSTYLIVKLEKNRPTAEEDELGYAAPWEKVTAVPYDSIPQEKIGEMLAQADAKYGTDLGGRRNGYLPVLNRQIDDVTNHLRDEEEDECFEWQLLQIEEHLKPLDKPPKLHPDKELKVPHRGSSRKSSKASSTPSKSKTKSRSERVSLTLYYRRAPGRQQNVLELYKTLKSRKVESKTKEDTPPASVPQSSPPDRSTLDREYAPPIPHATRPPMSAQPYGQPFYAAVPGQPEPILVYPQLVIQPSQVPYLGETYTDRQQANAEPRQQPPQRFESSQPYPNQPQPPAVPSQHSYPGRTYAERQQTNTEPRQEPPRGYQPVRPYPDQSQPAVVPSRPANVPPPPPPIPVPPKPSVSYGEQDRLSIPPDIEVIYDDHARQGSSRQRGGSPRIRRVPSTQSPEYYDDYDDAFHSTAASVDSGSIYTYGAARPKPGPARPRSSSRVRSSREAPRPRAEAPRTVDAYRAPNPFDSRAARSTRPRNENRPRRAHVSPEREVDHSDYSYGSDAELHDARIMRRRSAQEQSEPRDRDSRREPGRRDWRAEAPYGYFQPSTRRNR